jgi:hypothetical protein
MDDEENIKKLASSKEFYIGLLLAISSSCKNRLKLSYYSADADSRIHF